MLLHLNFSSDEEVISKIGEYQRLIGSLQYLTLTQTDIQYAINKLAQFSQAPTKCHWMTVIVSYDRLR